MDKAVKIVPAFAAAVFIGLAIGLLAGIGMFSGYIESHTETCQTYLDECIDAYYGCNPLARYQGNFSFINYTLGGG